MALKRRTFLASGAAALCVSKGSNAARPKRSAPVDAMAAFEPAMPGPAAPYAAAGAGMKLAAGQVVVTGVSGVNEYQLSNTSDVRDDLIAIFQDALSQLPAHIEFGPGDLHIADMGITIALPRGGRGLSLSGSGTRLRLTGPSPFSAFWHCLRFRTDTTGIDPASGQDLPDEELFTDLSISNMSFYDDDPVAHAQLGTEETHGINLQWVRNARITNCVVDNVGDEAIELDYCKNAVVAHNTLTNTTQQELGGGGAISVKNGCQNISILGNTIRDGAGFATYGIAIKVINPAAVRNVVIAGNSISNMVTGGININITGNGQNQGIGLLDSVSITGNVIEGGQFGVSFTGGSSNGHTGRAIEITGNAICGQSSNGIRMFLNQHSTVNVCNNSFSDIGQAGIVARGNGLQFADNNMTNVRGACVELLAGADAAISGGIYSACGEDAVALFDEGNAFSNVSINDVSVLDCRAPTVVRNIRQICGCTMTSDAAGTVLAPKMIDISVPAKGPAAITDNVLTDGCIKAGVGDSVVSGNRIVQTRDPGANALRIFSSASHCVVSGNHIAAFGSRAAIEVAGDDALVIGNHLARSQNPILNTGVDNSLVANKGIGANRSGAAGTKSRR